ALEPAQICGQPQPRQQSRARQPLVCKQLWPALDRAASRKPDPRKFRDPASTATREARAQVALARLKTVWFNTGTVCNISCRNCYIESSPSSDRLAYLRRSEVTDYLDEIERGGWGTEEIGFTGGEPCMNPECLGM